MDRNEFQSRLAFRFCHFSNRSYAVFRTLNKAVSIGVLTIPTLLFAQTESLRAQVQSEEKVQLYELEEIEVTGSRVPLTLGQAARMVTVLDRQSIAAAPVESVNDLLKYAIGVDVRQRGDMGVQTDISIRGGTFDQITILLNGINICDPQTGHNAADFPVDLSEIERIEVLEGPAGRVYGTSSLVGAINIVTRTEPNSSAEVHAEGGSYGFFQGGARANIAKGDFNNQLSGSYTRSDGFSRNQAGGLNADFQTTRLFYQGQFKQSDIQLRWHAGFSNKEYGSNTFYSAKYDDQFEHTRKYFGALQAETSGSLFHFRPAIYWNRSEDRFELFRGQPDKVPFNYHRTDVYGVNLNSYVETSLGKTAFGAELRNEGIISTNLGEPLSQPKTAPDGVGTYKVGLNRTNISFHLEHTLLLNRFTLSAGVIAVKNTGNEMNFRFYPGVDASYQLARNWKAYASFNTSLRMPTFTELYYSVGGHAADKNLKPEEMNAYEVGVKYLSGGVRGTTSLYYHHGMNMIDWIMDMTEGDEAVWRSVNHTKLNTLGVETSWAFDLPALTGWDGFLRTLHVGYSYIDQSKDLDPSIQSKYALEYLKHKLVAQADFRVWSRLQLHVAYRWQDRVGTYQVYQSGVASDELAEYSPYSLLDARLSWNADRYKVYVEANNLLNKTYYDHGNIPQPGIWVKAGISWRIFR
ncbi:MAG: TonB-dependent receptor [Parabacteroides sp.]